MTGLEDIKRWLGTRMLREDTRAVLKERLTYLSPKKLHRLEDALAEIERDGIAGDILEFGVALGGSAIILAGHAQNGRSFHGFDVFAMIPPPTSDKDDDKSRERYDVIRSGRSTGIDGDEYYGYRDSLFEDVKASFARHKRPINGHNIHLHKGLFEETWPKASIDRIAFAHIDCDWYDPVRYCLEAVAVKLSPGGLLLIDDYNDYGGARTAVDEFIAGRPGFTFEAGPNPILRKSRTH
ncbi:MAG TPA: TylF/MycF/NovP-related O-methyltransferase [Rhizomicrobium sp.]|nr:TylF/MycF/NovP-related O-methyltransferase [Rhizomicrobium sp.]